MLRPDPRFNSQNFPCIFMCWFKFPIIPNSANSELPFKVPIFNYKPFIVSFHRRCVLNKFVVSFSNLCFSFSETAGWNPMVLSTYIKIIPRSPDQQFVFHLALIPVRNLTLKLLISSNKNEKISQALGYGWDYPPATKFSTRFEHHLKSNKARQWP